MREGCVLQSDANIEGNDGVKAEGFVHAILSYHVSGQSRKCKEPGDENVLVGISLI